MKKEYYLDNDGKIIPEILQTVCDNGVSEFDRTMARELILARSQINDLQNQIDGMIADARVHAAILRQNASQKLHMLAVCRWAAVMDNRNAVHTAHLEYLLKFVKTEDK